MGDFEGKEKMSEGFDEKEGNLGEVKVRLLVEWG